MNDNLIGKDVVVISTWQKARVVAQSADGQRLFCVRRDLIQGCLGKYKSRDVFTVNRDEIATEEKLS